MDTRKIRDDFGAINECANNFRARMIGALNTAATLLNDGPEYRAIAGRIQTATLAMATAILEDVESMYEPVEKDYDVSFTRLVTRRIRAESPEQAEDILMNDGEQVYGVVSVKESQQH